MLAIPYDVYLDVLQLDHLIYIRRIRMAPKFMVKHPESRSHEGRRATAAENDDWHKNQDNPQWKGV